MLGFLIHVIFRHLFAHNDTCHILFQKQRVLRLVLPVQTERQTKMRDINIILIWFVLDYL